MDLNNAVSTYLSLVSSISNYWLLFGTIGALIIGWLISRSNPINIKQKIVGTFFYFTCTGYLVSCLMARYRLLNSFIKDLASIESLKHLQSIKEITKYQELQQHYEVIVQMSYLLISVLFLYLIWSNIVYRKTNRTKN